MRACLAIIAAVTLLLMTGPGVAGAKRFCRTVVVHGTRSDGTPRMQASVSVHRCDRIKVEFVFPTQNTLVYLWRVTHKPAKKVLKLASHGYGKSTAETGTQVWLYRAVGKGKTYVKFGDFTPSYPNQPAAATFKLKVAVR